MLWKCYTQYASKFGKLSSGHRTGKGQFSFQPQRKAMPKNVQTTAQLHSSHMLAKQCSKFSKPGFNSTWTVNFQLFKLVLEKAEEPEIKLPTSVESSKKQESSKKKHLYWLCQSLWLWITTNWKIQEMEITDHLTCLLRTMCASQKATELDVGTTGWFQIGKGVCQGCILSPFLLNSLSTLCEMPGWMKHKLESRLLGEISITSDT